ncbi:hypothetical protein HPB51_023933 [Rhipicephalus microplus]|uniref:Septin-type G domain-containing protein n=1 Tax=Rhipicephalus microplus TaxID=6941 RepID=A0A9J6DDK2_RHIMP|nr:hypothetical protein HPB51_023933 [Rhipicephalus microplus]
MRSGNGDAWDLRNCLQSSAIVRAGCSRKTFRVENMDHCDYIALRNMLVRTHMQDLKDITNSVHYENYRCRKLAGVGGTGEPGHGRSNKSADEIDDFELNTSTGGEIPLK